jgi:hypothetical protein
MGLAALSRRGFMADARFALLRLITSFPTKFFTAAILIVREVTKDLL